MTFIVAILRIMSAAALSLLVSMAVVIAALSVLQCCSAVSADQTGSDVVSVNTRWAGRLMTTYSPDSGRRSFSALPLLL